MKEYQPFTDLEHAKNLGFPPGVIEEKIFPIFLQTIPDDLGLLKDAYQKEDWKTVQRIAHKLKGGAAYCGASRMREACDRLEAYLIEGKTELRDKLYELVLTEIGAATKNIEEILAKRKNGKKEKAT